MAVMKGIERVSAAVGLLVCAAGLVWMFVGSSSPEVTDNANVVGGVSALVGLGWLLLQAFRGGSGAEADPDGDSPSPPPIIDVDEDGDLRVPSRWESVRRHLGLPGVVRPWTVRQWSAASGLLLVVVVICVVLSTAGRPDHTVPASATSPQPAVPSAAGVTRFISPVTGDRVSFPFSARVELSAADAQAGDTVLALSICVGGRCYLDEKILIVGGVPLPYQIYLGGDATQGDKAAWTLRLDRLSTAAFTALESEKKQESDNHTWGKTESTPMSDLNGTPVSSVTVTKAD
jgi:hypothetical protein